MTDPLGARDINRSPAAIFGEWVATVSRDSRVIEVSRNGVGPDVVSDDAGQLLFDGVLYNADDLRRGLGPLDSELRSDAEIVLTLLRRHGPDVVHHLRGQWVLLARDRASGDVFCARDHYGQHGCFYVEQDRALLVSPSVESLVRHPGVSGEINRVAVADHIRLRWPVLDETYYEAVRRLPGGYRLTYRNGTKDARRYWLPNREIDRTLTPEDTQERFDELLHRAVARCMYAPTAIYLSGGLDSVSVAAFAVEHAASSGNPRPYALSLVFEHESVSEEEVQIGVARQLGLEQTIVPLMTTVPESGLLRAALEMSEAQPAPMLNLWSPGYRSLAIDGRRQGRAVILTGSGGDEWLDYPAHDGERLIREGDLVGLYRAWRMLVRSRNVTRMRLARNLVWTYGASFIVRGAASKTLKTLAPGALRARRRRRIASEASEWLVDDPVLLDQILERYEAAAPRLREPLDSPLTALQFEEVFERSRMLGLRTAHPLWDVDLTAFVERLPAESLTYGGRTKGLVRFSLAERFPDLGFESQRKLAATPMIRSVVMKEAVVAWRELGGAKALAALGVVDRARMERRMEALLTTTDLPNFSWVWYVLTLEAWLRRRV